MENTCEKKKFDDCLIQDFAYDFENLENEKEAIKECFYNISSDLATSNVCFDAIYDYLKNYFDLDLNKIVIEVSKKHFKEDKRFIHGYEEHELFMEKFYTDDKAVYQPLLNDIAEEIEADVLQEVEKLLYKEMPEIVHDWELEQQAMESFYWDSRFY